MSFNREKTLEAAQRYASRGQHEKAAREYRAVVDHDPKDLRIWLRLADSLQRAGQTERAMDCFMQVGRVYSDEGDNQKALAVYRQALSVEPNRMDIVLKCGQLYRALGRTAEAIHAFETVAQNSVKRGKTKDALALYRTVVEIEPDSISRRLRLAELFSRENLIDDAVGEFRICADHLLSSEQHAQYVRVAERLLYHREDDDVLRELVRVYLQIRQPRRALVKLNSLLQRNHSDFEGLELLAETFLALGKRDKGLSVILELVRASTGQGEAAREAASRAVLLGLDEMPNHPDLLRAGAELSAAADEEDEAEEIHAEDAYEDDFDDEAMELDDDVVELVEESGIEEIDANYIEEVDEVEELREFDELGADDAVDLSSQVRDLSPGEDTVVRHIETETQGRRRSARATRAKAATKTAKSAKSATSAASASSALPEDVLNALTEARVLFKFRLFTHAERHLSGVLKRYPNHPEALRVKIESLVLQGQPGEALALRMKLAEVFAREQKLEEAREQIREILAVEPDHRAALSLRSHLDSNVAEEPTRVAALRHDQFPGESSASAVPQAVAETGSQELLESGPFPLELSEDDFSIEVQEPPAVEEDTVTVENRFDLDEESAAKLKAAVPAPVPAPVEPEAIDASEEEFREDERALGAWSAEASSESLAVFDDDIGSALDALDPPEASARDVAIGGAAWDDSPESISREGQPAAFLEDSDTQRMALDADLGAEIGLELDPPATGQTFDDIADDVDEGLAAETYVDEAGLPSADSQTPIADALDDELQVELGELDFFIEEGLLDDARELLDELEERFGSHFALAAYRAQLDPVAKSEAVKDDVPPPVAASASTAEDGDDFLSRLLSDEEADEALSALEPMLGGDGDASLDDFDASAPVVDADDDAEPVAVSSSPVDDEEDAYLTSIFDDSPPAASPSEAAQSSAGAKAETHNASAATRYDVALAYRDMGLLENAMSELRTCLEDEDVRCRAALLLGELERETGAALEAKMHLNRALEWAKTQDEGLAARYELGVTLQHLSETDAARRCLAALPPEFRDVQQRLAQIG